MPFRTTSSVIALAAAVLSLSSHCLQAQALTGQAQRNMLTSARSQYYNLSVAGVKSFACNVDVDWDALFTSVQGKPLPADSPMMQYLHKSRLSMSADMSGQSDVSWADTGAPPEGTEKGVDQMRGGMKQTLEGFLQAWMPSLSGSLISLSPVSVTPSAGGYVIDDSSGKDKDKVTLDKNLVVTHISSQSDAMEGELDMTFAPSAKGLLLSKLDGLYKQPPGSPATHVIMTSTFQPVGAFQLPAALSFTVANVASFKMQLTGCTVQKQP